MSDTQTVVVASGRAYTGPARSYWYSGVFSSLGAARVGTQYIQANMFFKTVSVPSWYKDMVRENQGSLYLYRELVSLGLYQAP